MGEAASCLSHLMEAFSVEDIFASCCVQLSLDEEATQVSHQPPVAGNKGSSQVQALNAIA